MGFLYLELNPADNKEMVELAARICRDYLHDSWKDVTPENIVFKHISGGLSNLLYYISLPQDLIEKEQNHLCPKEVLIRFYGQTHGERALEALITESVIFTLLSERGLGPKLHGIFPGGRIEEYIKARPLKLRELADDTLSVLIAKKIAAIHCMEVPLHKAATWLWDTIDKWIKTVEVKQKGNVPPQVERLAKFDFKEEAAWLKQRIEAENSPVVFCHNDMQEGNILVAENGECDQNGNPNIVIIDFEYCSYNYRAFDIANHFAEWLYDYTFKEPPYFEECPDNYPSEAQRLRFIKTYLNEVGSKENPKKVLKEVEVFTLASHFFWSLWGIVNTDSQITFGYWDYAAARLDGYLRAKSELPPLKAVKRKAED
ncbi:choline/ethanolamine kinase isoform X2 [Agrilus planipennis]|uniref:Choline/ethanolamine kinase isoform X2 n=1 Tax=Agrilus planipennis TaxID=224129 RepID=A0A1W4X1K7_AGRPL|nr:choline/ethanolamine kinase isoform X2 [Agrilus planipennis]